MNDNIIPLKIKKKNKVFKIDEDTKLRAEIYLKRNRVCLVTKEHPLVMDAQTAYALAIILLSAAKALTTKGE